MMKIFLNSILPTLNFICTLPMGPKPCHHLQTLPSCLVGNGLSHFLYGTEKLFTLEMYFALIDAPVSNRGLCTPVTNMDVV